MSIVNSTALPLNIGSTLVSSTNTAVTILNSDSPDGIVIDGPPWFLQAEFDRSGPDLQLTGPEGQQLILRNYFNQSPAPDIMSNDGVVLNGATATRLAGPVAPGQFAQASPGGASEPIGQVETLTGGVKATRADGTVSELAQGDNVFLGDILETAADGSVGIVFADESTFSLGEDGRMTLDEMVYDAAEQSGSIGVSMLQGAFTFVSGQVAKTDPGAMVITTPTATIGIRGTAGGGTVGEGGDTTAALLPEAGGFTGEMTIGNDAGTQTINQPLQAINVASINQPPSPPFVMSPQQMGQAFGSALTALPNGGNSIPNNVRDGAQEGQAQQQAAQQAVAEAETQQAEAEAAAQEAEAAQAEAEAAAEAAQAAEAEAAVAAEAAAAEALAAEVAAVETAAQAEALAAQAVAAEAAAQEAQLAAQAADATPEQIAAAEAAVAEATAAQAAAETATAEAQQAEVAQAQAKAQAAVQTAEAKAAAAQVAEAQAGVAEAAAGAATAEAQLATAGAAVAQAQVAAIQTSSTGAVASAAVVAGVQVRGSSELGAAQEAAQAAQEQATQAEAQAVQAQTQAAAAQAVAQTAQAEAQAAQTAATEAQTQAEAQVQAIQAAAPVGTTGDTPTPVAPITIIQTPATTGNVGAGGLPIVTKTVKVTDPEEEGPITPEVVPPATTTPKDTTTESVNFSFPDSTAFYDLVNDQNDLLNSTYGGNQTMTLGGQAQAGDSYTGSASTDFIEFARGSDNLDHTLAIQSTEYVTAPNVGAGNTFQLNINTAGSTQITPGASGNYSISGGTSSLDQTWVIASAIDGTTRDILLDGGAGNDIVTLQGGSVIKSMSGIEYVKASGGSLTFESTLSGTTLMSTGEGGSITLAAGGNTINVGQGGGYTGSVSWDSIAGGTGSDTLNLVADGTSAYVYVSSVNGIEFITGSLLNGATSAGISLNSTVDQTLTASGTFTQFYGGGSANHTITLGSSTVNSFSNVYEQTGSLTFIDGGATNDTISLASSSTLIKLSGTIETVTGNETGTQGVTLVGTTNNIGNVSLIEIINGGSGTDSISMADLGATKASVTTTGSIESFTGGNQTDIITLSGTGASISNVSLVEQISGSANDDTVSLKSSDTTTVTISANNGNDIITAGGGTTTIYGGSGTDTITAGNGTSTIYGETGNDTMTAGSGTDTFRYNHADDGTDLINSFAVGTDKFEFYTTGLNRTNDGGAVGVSSLGSETLHQVDGSSSSILGDTAGVLYEFYHSSGSMGLALDFATSTDSAIITAAENLMASTIFGSSAALQEGFSGSALFIFYETSGQGSSTDAVFIKATADGVGDSYNGELSIMTEFTDITAGGFTATDITSYAPG